MAENPGRHYLISGYWQERQGNYTLTRSLDLSLPLCEACYRQWLILNDYDAYARANDPAYSRKYNLLVRWSIGGIFVSLLAAALFLGLRYFQVWPFPLAYLGIPAFLFAISVVLFLLSEPRIYDRGLKQQLQTVARTQFREAKIELGSILEVRFDNAEYAVLVQALNPGSYLADNVRQFAKQVSEAISKQETVHLSGRR